MSGHASSTTVRLAEVSGLIEGYSTARAEQLWGTTAMQKHFTSHKTKSCDSSWTPCMLYNAKTMNSVTSDISQAQSIESLVNYPERLAVLTSYRCNYKCIMCPLHHVKTESLPESVLDKLEPIFPFIKKLVLSGGEPLLDKNWVRWFFSGAQNGVSCEMNTNGSLLCGDVNRILAETADVINISIDAATDKTYRLIRGAALKNIFSNIDDLVSKCAATRRQLKICFRFVAMSENIEELTKVVSIAARLGVRHISVCYLRVHTEDMVQQSLFFHKERSDYHMCKAKEVARHLGVEITLPQLFSDTSHEPDVKSARGICKDPWKYLEVAPNGATGLCCGFAGQGGNIITDSFSDVWNHAQKKLIRKTVNSAKPVAPCDACMVGKTLDPNSRASHLTPSILDTMEENLPH